MLSDCCRLPSLLRVIKQWDGFVSAAVYLKKQQIPVLRANLSNQPADLLRKTDIHAVIDDGVRVKCIYGSCVSAQY